MSWQYRSCMTGRTRTGLSQGLTSPCSGIRDSAVEDRDQQVASSEPPSSLRPAARATTSVSGKQTLITLAVDLQKEHFRSQNPLDQASWFHPLKEAMVKHDLVCQAALPQGPLVLHWPARTLRALQHSSCAGKTTHLLHLCFSLLIHCVWMLEEA